jgi:hypothetical protein
MGVAGLRLRAGDGVKRMGLFSQNELVVSGNAESIVFAVVADQDFLAAME